MPRRKKELFFDLIIVAISVAFAFWIEANGLADQIVGSLGGLSWLGIIMAGMFFTSLFTTAPAIAMLGEFAQFTPLPALIVLGGLGAVLGDYLIFRFIKDRISDDLKYLLSFRRKRRWPAIFRTRLFRYFVPFIGALIIASPFPDELGIAMLGLSRLDSRVFFIISFVMNGLGIGVIGWLAQSVV